MCLIHPQCSPITAITVYVSMFPVQNDRPIIAAYKSIIIHIVSPNVVLDLFVNLSSCEYYKFWTSICYLWPVDLLTWAHTTRFWKKYFVGKASKMEYHIKHFIKCKTTHVIYRLECPQCKVFYIGRTKGHLQDRLAEHKYAIQVGNEDYPMARHYKSLLEEKERHTY